MLIKNQMEKEKHDVKMLLSVASNKKLFLELVGMYEKFYSADLNVWLKREHPIIEILNNVQKKLHYFKGGFSQFHLIRTCELIHEFEVLLQSLRKNTELISHEDLKSFFESNHFELWLKEELNLLKITLGATFFENRNDTIFRNQLINIEQKVISIVPLHVAKELIVDLCKLRYKPIGELLMPIETYFIDLAESMSKPVKPLIIKTDETLIDPDQFSHLFDILGHIVRNVVDHGIRAGDREAPIMVKISCESVIRNQLLSIEIHHNGVAVDLEALRIQALQNDIHDEETLYSLSRDELLQLVFREGITTKDEATLLSGMGFGLSIVKEQIEKIGGTVSIRSDEYEGVLFSIHVPYDSIDYLDETDYILRV